MSYNITAIKIKKINLKIPLKDFLLITDSKITIEHYSDIENYTTQITIDDDIIYGKLTKDGILEVVDVQEDKYTNDYPITERIVDLCKKYKGSINMIVVWEGGDEIERVVVENGVVKEVEKL